MPKIAAPKKRKRTLVERITACEPKALRELTAAQDFVRALVQHQIGRIVHERDRKRIEDVRELMQVYVRFEMPWFVFEISSPFSDGSRLWIRFDELPCLRSVAAKCVGPFLEEFVPRLVKLARRREATRANASNPEYQQAEQLERARRAIATEG